MIMTITITMTSPPPRLSKNRNTEPIIFKKLFYKATQKENPMILLIGFSFYLSILLYKKNYFFASFPLSKSITSGVAIQMDEYVPITIPINNANENPRIVSPPKMKIANNTKKIVNEVLIVRLNVLF